MPQTSATDTDPPHSAHVAPLSPQGCASLPADAVDVYPLSTLQAGVLFEAARASGKGLYHDVLTYRMRGRLEVAAFTRAVDALVARHPIFRTSFHLDGLPDPVQVVHASVPTPLRVCDLRGLSADEQDAVLAADAERERAEGFRPGAPDLVRFRIHLLSEDEYQYTLSYHDAAIDSASVAIVHHDLFELYFALTRPPSTDSRGGREEQQVDPNGYRRFVALERAAIESEEHARFWASELDGSEGTRIPRYADVPPGTPDRLGVHDVALPAGLAEAVGAAARAMSVPVATLLAAAHVKVLSFVSGSTDVLTGYEHSGRPDDAAGRRLVGLFLNTLPFRVRCEPGSWRQLVAAVQTAHAAVSPYRRFPMAEIKRRAGIRGLLVETVLNVRTVESFDDLARHGFALPQTDLNARTEFPFRAEFAHDPVTGDLRFALHYHTGQFSPVQIERIAGYYVTALLRLTADPDTQHDSVSLMDDEETRLVSSGFCGPERELPSGTFADLFGRTVAEWPHRTALVHRGQHLDYTGLATAARRLGGWLRRNGMQPGVPCAVALSRGVDWAVTTLAVLLYGGVYVPLDPRHPPARLAASAARAGAGLLVTEADRAEAIRAALAAHAGTPGGGGGGRCQVLTYDHGAGDTGDLPADWTGGPGDDAYILFTSGSTGEPKGARITHAGMLNHLLAKVAELSLGPDDRIAQTASQSFDISVWQLLAGWLVGARTVIYDTDQVTDAPSFLDSLAADGVTVVELVPSHLDAVLAEHARRPRPLPALRWGMVTGEPVPVRLVRRWFDQVGVPLVNAYGPTEAADDVTHLVLRAPVHGTRVPVGRALPNTGIHVLGPDGRHRPIGSLGEIVVTGVGVGRGYVNDPERTDEVFVPNTLDHRSALMYRTGDIGRWLPDGTLDCVGRIDNQVKLRGFRIELAEVEGALADVDDVDGAVAVVTGADGDRRLVAVCVTKADARLELGQVRQSLARTLPAYMLPDALVTLDRFPLTSNGKVDRGALHRLASSARSQSAVANATIDSPNRTVTTAVGGTGDQPMTPNQRYVAELFAQVLPAARIGLDEDFFEIGGHSLAAMKMASRSGGRLAVRDIVTCPTVRGLAELLDSGDVSSRPLLVRLAAARPGAPALVCAPYAGGGAVNFLPLARALSRRGCDLAVYGIDPPGRTLRDPVPAQFGFDRLAELVADELAAAGHTWTAVFGHCSGSVLALRVARELAERDVVVPRVFVAAKVLASTDPAAFSDDEFGRFTDEEVIGWLRANIGVAELGEMTPVEMADLAHAFRADSVAATQMLHEATAAPQTARVASPLTHVVALDDALTSGYAEAAANWELFTSDGVTVTSLPDGGHYFNRTRPGPLAELIATALGL